MTYVLFQEAGLMETFRIPQREFVNFFRALEANYGSNVCTSRVSLLLHTCPNHCFLMCVQTVVTETIA